MELRPGYKQTGVGVIPEDWEVVKFSDLMDFRNGVNADKDAYGKGIPFINVLEVITRPHLHISDIPGSVTLSKQVVESYMVCKGDIFFNRTSETQEEVGLTSVYLGDENVVFGGFVIRGRPKNQLVDSIYSGYAFRSAVIRSQIIAKGQGAIRANIGQQNLSEVLAPLPSLPEQRAIAAALSDVDSLINGLDQLIAKKRDLKQAAMQQLLTGKQRLPGFRGEWEVKRLGDVVEIKKGQLITENDAINGSVPVIAGGKKPSYFHNRPNRTGKTITISGSGASAGYVAFFDAPIFASDCSTISEGSSYSIEFIYFVLHLRQGEIYKAQTGGAQPHIHPSDLMPLIVNIPDANEQTAIATVLADMDAEIAALEQRRNKTRGLKQGMMQELLTGRIRLI